MEEIQVVTEQPKLMHPDIIAEFPGIETKDMYGTEASGPTADQDTIPSFAVRVTSARVNAGLDDDN